MTGTILWIDREPTPEEIAEREALQARAAEEAAEARKVETEREIAWRLGPDVALRAMGKITVAELQRREALVRADVLAENQI